MTITHCTGRFENTNSYATFESCMQKSHHQFFEHSTGIALSADSQCGCKPNADDFGSNSNFDKQEFITAKMSLSKMTPKCGLAICSQSK
ncbi:hypothetical protein OAE40_02930, partial [Rubripirellula sp.]|nr:hypothetical protein [Rubripirellula sp.]